MHLYSQVKGVIMTREWKSDPFYFSNGIFTGDNYSPIIFIAVFEPLIVFIKSKNMSAGYSLGDTQVVTKLFHDKLKIITIDKGRH